MDFLKSAVASAISKGPLGPYSVADKLNLDPSIWTLNNATKRDGNITCSVFSFDLVANKSRAPLARNALRKFRTLRHPGVLKVLDTIETDTQIFIITERVTPLSWHFRRNDLTAETLKWGLWNVSKTLKFINEGAASVHGCVRASSVFSSEAGEWKLGGFEVTSSMKDDEAVIFTHTSLVPDSGRFLPPEVLKGGWDAIKRNPVTAVDAYGYGTLLYETFNGTFTGVEQMSQPKNIPPSMQQSFRRLMNQNPKARLSVPHFLDQGSRDGGFFQTPLIHLSEGIESLGLKSEEEREAFLSQLSDATEDFPEDFLKMKVLPELLKSVEFGGGGPKVFKLVLQIGKKLSDDEYDTQMTPVLVRLFSSPDRAIRVCLLDNLPLMIDHLSAKIVNDKIFPNMVTGFTDVAPLVREQTVKSVLTIITKLTDRTINGELLKYLARTANDEQPGIRTNTTICLGKIARNLSNNTRTKVLVAAFTRSLRDPFVHARNAALMALSATVDYFTEDDCASKLLPPICPALIDKERVVRDQANKTLDVYLNKVRKHAQTLPDTLAPQTSSASDGTASAPRMGTPVNDSSWAGWAISSFTNKLTSADGQIEPKTNGAVVRPSAARNPFARSTAEISRPTSAASLTPPVGRSSQASPTVKSDGGFGSNEADVWSGWDDHNDEADEVEDAWGVSRDSFFDAPSASTPSIKTTTLNDDGEPDFAGWLKAQSKTKSKAPLPKGLSKAAGSTITSSRPKSARPVVKANIAASTSSKTPTSTKSSIAKKTSEPPAADQDEADAWGDAWD